MEMCFHGNRVSWGINHSFINLYSKYQPPSFICSPIMLVPVISSLNEIYCTLHLTHWITSAAYVRWGIHMVKSIFIRIGSDGLRLTFSRVFAEERNLNNGFEYREYPAYRDKRKWHIFASKNGGSIPKTVPERALEPILLSKNIVMVRPILWP